MSDELTQELELLVIRREGARKFGQRLPKRDLERIDELERLLLSKESAIPTEDCKY